MNILPTATYEEMSQKAATFVAEAIEQKPNLVLGLPTGGTPVGLYAELVSRFQAGALSFAQVTTFNLDEYVGLAPTHPQSYSYFMHQHLFDTVNLAAARTHLPNGCAPDLQAECQAYEAAIQEARGIDLQVVGIGANGHLGFNEPGTSFDSLTHQQELTEKTRQDNARYFRSLDEVPQYALTMGLTTIMSAHAILFIASGQKPANALAKVLNGPCTEAVPASILQRHPNVTIIADHEALAQCS